MDERIVPVEIDFGIRREAIVPLAGRIPEHLFEWEIAVPGAQIRAVQREVEPVLAFLDNSLHPAALRDFDTEKRESSVRRIDSHVEPSIRVTIVPLEVSPGAFLHRATKV